MNEKDAERDLHHTDPDLDPHSTLSPPSTPSTIAKEIEVETPHSSPRPSGEASRKDEVQVSSEQHRAASVRSEHKPPVPVPRSERRGLLARLTVIPEVEEPHDYARKTKWTITFVVAVAGAAAPMGSAIILPALADISRSLHSTPTITNLSVAMYMLSMSIFPLWWSSFSETLGRRTIYLTSFTLFVLFAILSAVSPNISMFVTMRVLSGGAAASVQAVGAGTIADVWEVKERGRAMGMFYIGPLCGPLLAPIIGGALAERLGWRSTQWFLTVYGGFLLTGLLFCLPETLKAKKNVVAEAEADAAREIAAENNLDGDEGKRPHRPTSMLQRVPTRQSVHVQTKKWILILRRCLLDPLKIILYLRFPAVALTVYYASITFGCLYVLNISVQQTFSQPPYNFSTVIIGLLYIPNSVGYILASLYGGRWVDRIMHREARKAGRYDEHGKLVFIPEDRMRENAWVAAVLFPAALIWYGWSAQKGVFWVVPMIANFFFGIGSMLIFAMATTMLTEFMPRKASHGIAVNNFVRNIFSCVGGVVAHPLIDAIGNGWLWTGLGVIALASGGGVIWAMRRFGKGWRVKMDREMGTG
ncbi:major facilitator superfamily protein [Cryomyces antarcticus]|uniref:Major facilitator superfamily (MFS) profile domain-containing protein n=1 Tax=Cryomyces antarcticus TaxID=329879 RepID=A0ABR0M8M8_9PEZI|nr:hypothetical protein LTR39_000283 [Cryomyces antarcticus]KAK5020051.1 hypothetical protein LTR60_000886 [Cryomyces antarcticus]KAK5295691.1 hypothetical protein LTR16_000877 [Cryomyces antarcticus]